MGTHEILSFSLVFGADGRRLSKVLDIGVSLELGTAYLPHSPLGEQGIVKNEEHTLKAASNRALIVSRLSSEYICFVRGLAFS